MATTSVPAMVVIGTTGLYGRSDNGSKPAPYVPLCAAVKRVRSARRALGPMCAGSSLTSPASWSSVAGSWLGSGIGNGGVSFVSTTGTAPPCKPVLFGFPTPILHHGLCEFGH